MGKLSLKIENNTVGTNSGPGYTSDQVYLLIQGQIGDPLVYQWYDWETKAWKAMAESDNTISLNQLGVDPSVKYANYGKSLSEIAALGASTNGEINIPVPVFGGRVYLSFEKPVYLHINTGSSPSGPSPAEPADDNPHDPNYTTIYDKFEFAVGNDNVLFSNTTAVDFVGIPLVYSMTHGSVTKGPVGFDIPTSEKGDPLAYVTGKIAADPNFKSLVTPYRVFAPKVTDESFAPDFGKDGDYLANYIKFCWSHYTDETNAITLWNHVDVTKAENSGLKSDQQGKSTKWTASGHVANNVLTFKLQSLVTPDGTDLPLPADDTFTIPLPSTYDTFRQGGVFTKDDTAHPEVYTQQIDGDIKNQVSTAINRCVMHGPYKGPSDPTQSGSPEAWWADVSAFYQQNGLSDANYQTNNYSQYLHERSYDNLCYALAYDDKFSQNVNISETIDDTATVMHVALNYLKEAGTKLKSATYCDKQITIKPDATYPDSEAVITFTPPAGTTVTKAFLAYQGVAGTDPDQYPAVEMPEVSGNYQINFAPGSFLSPFKFYVKYSAKGVAGEVLLPADAIGSKKPLEY